MKYIKTFESEENLLTDLMDMGYGQKGYYITILRESDGAIDGESLAVAGGNWESICKEITDFFGVDDLLSDGETFKDMGDLLDSYFEHAQELGIGFSFIYKAWELTPKGASDKTFIESEDILSPLKCVEIGQKNFIDFYKTKGEPDFNG